MSNHVNCYDSQCRYKSSAPINSSGHQYHITSETPKRKRRKKPDLTASFMPMECAPRDAPGRSRDAPPPSDVTRPTADWSVLPPPRPSLPGQPDCRLSGHGLGLGRGCMRYRSYRGERRATWRLFRPLICRFWEVLFLREETMTNKKCGFSGRTRVFAKMWKCILGIDFARGWNSESWDGFCFGCNFSRKPLIRPSQRNSSKTGTKKLFLQEKWWEIVECRNEPKIPGVNRSFPVNCRKWKKNWTRILRKGYY